MSVPPPTSEKGKGLVPRDKAPVVDAGHNVRALAQPEYRKGWCVYDGTAGSQVPTSRRRNPGADFQRARADGYIDYFNQRWQDALSVPLHELAGWAWTGLIHPDDLARHVQTWREAMASGAPAVSQARVRHANGEYRWMLHRTEALRDAEGNVVRWFGSSIDIEELRANVEKRGQAFEARQKAKAQILKKNAQAAGHALKELAKTPL